jgi:uncharacterized protein (TIGR02145 family)
MGTNWVSGDGDNEGIIIANDGKVGIGTSSPGGNLDVAGSIWQTGTGQSVFLGEGAGNSDDLSDNRNVFLGYRSGYSNSTGYYNTGTGYHALHSNTTGYSNTATGLNALFANIDGFYNTAAGAHALTSNTTGDNNTAYGYSALESNTTGNNSTAVGYNSLYSQTGNATDNDLNNTAIGYEALYTNNPTTDANGRYNVAVGHKALRQNSIGISNTAVGYQALYTNSIGSYNTANGYQALYSNTEGYRNIATGYHALYSNTTGYNNIATGYRALYSNTEGYYNIANGSSALYYNTTGHDNIANGFIALYSNTEGDNNIANGFSALYSNTEGDRNIANGTSALYYNTTGHNNIATGYRALYSNTDGDNNIATGSSALYHNTTGHYNIATGDSSLYSNTTGNNNIAIGSNSGYSNQTGTGNIFLGNEAGYNETGSNKLYIDNSDTISPLIYGEFDNDLVTINGKMGIGTSGSGTDASAMLDVASTDKGFLPPRVADTNAISNPAAGLMIFDQSCSCMQYYTGTKWIETSTESSSSTGSSTGVNCGDYFIDSRDGKEYNTVLIGNQCWMRENLNIGTMINGSNNQTDNGSIEKYCYDDDASNCDTYGGLYQWNEMMQYVTTEGVQGICPDGWHIPTDTEWKILEGELGMSTSDANITGWRGNTQGSMLAGNGYLWIDGSMDSNADFTKSGFTALPAGYRNTNGSFGNFTYNALFWSSSEDGPDAWRRGLGYNNAQVSRNLDTQAYGFSVRCARD